MGGKNDCFTNINWIFMGMSWIIPDELPFGKRAYIANWKDLAFFIGKSTISTGQFSLCLT